LHPAGTAFDLLSPLGTVRVEIIHLARGVIDAHRHCSPLERRDGDSDGSLAFVPLPAPSALQPVLAGSRGLPRGLRRQLIVPG
jgi:hypothetical protein